MTIHHTRWIESPRSITKQLRGPVPLLPSEPSGAAKVLLIPVVGVGLACEIVEGRVVGKSEVFGAMVVDKLKDAGVDDGEAVMVVAGTRSEVVDGGVGKKFV